MGREWRKKMKLLILLLVPVMLFAEKDSLRQYKFDEEIVVTGQNILDKKLFEQKNSVNSTEELLNFSPTVTLIKRGNFAAEPAVRGIGVDKLEVKIDDMHLFGACVDKMDPASSYLELENIEEIRINTSGKESSSQTGINLISNNTNFGEGIFGEASSYYGSASNLSNSRFNLSLSKENLSGRLSGTIKRAGNYDAGDGKVIKGSGFEKENFTFDLGLKAKEDNIFFITYTADFSRDAGFPALIMDTRDTKAHIFSIANKLSFTGKNIWQLDNKLYYNHIYHLMDDYSRSSEEINSREVMPGMYMPMLGTTETFGYVSKARFINKDIILDMKFNAYHLNAYGDMKMVPLDPNTQEMFLYNIADATSDNIDISGAVSSNFGELDYSVSANIGIRAFGLQNKDGKQALEAYINTEIPEFIYMPLAFSASAEHGIYKALKGKINISYRERSPNRFELFSYYIYNPLDDSFYAGNPDLKAEKNISTDLQFTYQAGQQAHSLTFFNNYYPNYIAGNLLYNAEPENPLFPQAVKQYQNTGAANIYGVEYVGFLNFSKVISTDLTARYNRGYSIALDDNLPFISPFRSIINLNYKKDPVVVSLSWTYSAEQFDNSRIFNNENQTASFNLFDVKVKYYFSDSLEIKAGVENILDTYYVEHTSLDDLPSQGRNIYVDLKFKF